MTNPPDRSQFKVGYPRPANGVGWLSTDRSARRSAEVWGDKCIAALSIFGEREKRIYGIGADAMQAYYDEQAYRYAVYAGTAARIALEKESA